jgi:CRISPR-associated protein Cmr2
MTVLFSCSIGPVQDFIATARRSRDLWYGSWLLSELSKAVAKHIADTYGFDRLIFPHPQKPESLAPNSPFNVPNRIVARLEQLDEVEAEKIHQALLSRLQDLQQEAFEKVKGPLSDQDLAIHQIMDLPEFYWVTVPFSGDSDYAQARDKAEAYLSARKNTRNFQQSVGAYVPKSSLDGIRESVIPESAYPEKPDSVDLRDRKIRELFHYYHARQAERLSGLDLLKRLGRGDDEPDFPSTSDLAAEPFLARLGEQAPTKKNEIIQEIKSFLVDKKEIDRNDISEEAALVFESRLFEYLPDKREQEEARKMLEKLLEKHFGKRRPNPYYALLIADGDNMGRLIDSKKRIEEHRVLSERLSSFAQQVPGIIKKHHGTCIYAGGEDILAYLPLHTTLACAKALESTFKDWMKDFVIKDENDGNIQPTLSGGIVIAHHLSPLSEVVDTAHRAEKEAKLQPGKNGLAIILNKRSGAERLICENWPVLIERLILLKEYFKSGDISGGAAYELQQLHLNLGGTEIPPRAIAKEAFRIVKRKKQSGGEKSVPQRVHDQFDTWLLEDGLSIQELALEMIIARDFAAAEKMAERSEKEDE